METGFWQAQAETAKTLNELSRLTATTAEKVENSVSHKELIDHLSEFRKEWSGKLDHYEIKLDQAIAKVEVIVDRAIDRVKESMGAAAVAEVKKAMAARRAREAEAKETITSRENDIDRRIRNANRIGAGGIGVGIIGFIAAIAQMMGWTGP